MWMLETYDDLEQSTWYATNPESQPYTQTGTYATPPQNGHLKTLRNRTASARRVQASRRAVGICPRPTQHLRVYKLYLLRDSRKVVSHRVARDKS